jgi:hypothetical protein
MSNVIKKRAFRHERDCSHCTVKRDREAKITKVKEDIALLDKFSIPHPKADTQLSVLSHFQALCKDEKCHEV